LPRARRFLAWVHDVLHRGLKAPLRRWHQLAHPGWDEAQVDEVASALNAAVFRFAVPVPARA